MPKKSYLGSMQWESIHIFYQGEADECLRKQLLPYLKAAPNRQYFFVRYREGGPHIRLRISPPPTRNELRKAFPSAQFIPYEAETERYGGEHGLLVSEVHFHLSSQIALELIQQDDWDEEGKRAAAIQLYLAWMAQSDLPKAEVVHFFARMCKHWMGFLRNQQQTYSQLIHSFRAAYQQQSGNIHSFVQEMWINLKKEEEWTETWLNTWITHAQETDAQLHALHQAQLLTQAPAQIYEHYFHMMNNRLGIPNHEEAFLAYILMRALGDSSA